MIVSEIYLGSRNIIIFFWLVRAKNNTRKFFNYLILKNNARKKTPHLKISNIQ